MISWFGTKKKVTPLAKKKDDFVSLSSHELRTPLSVIKWYTEMLLDGDAGPLTEEQQKYLTTIQISNQRAIDLVRSLLNVSRLDLGTFCISPQKLDVISLLKEVSETVKGQITKKDLSFVFSGEAESVLNVDDKLTRMVLKEVLLNAALYSRDKGVIKIACNNKRAGTLIAGTHVLEDSLVISVQDNGIGIPDKDKPSIFSKMFRASNVKDTEVLGSGLGLYIAKTIVQDSCKGNIWFFSEEGVGSTFYISFPLRGMLTKKGTTTLD